MKKKNTKKITKKICVYCKAEIKGSDTYYKVDLYSKGKLTATDYAHKSCKDGSSTLNLQNLDVNKLMEVASPLIG
jgi:hypothetical protein